MKRTKIVCTLGPASRDVTTLYRMGQAGMDVARLNFSHGTHEDHATILKHLNVAGKRLGRSFAVLQDLQGPKIRVGELPKDGVKLVAGKQAVFATGANPLPSDIPVTLQSLHQDVKKGERMLLDDGLLEVKVVRVEGRRIFTEVLHGGTLTSHKGLNLPGSKLRLPALSDKDREDALFGVKLGVDYIALSFVRSPEDVKDLRALLDRRGKNGSNIRIIVKIEKQEAIDRFDAILPLADAVMIARGDLGIETEASGVPVIQKQLIAACREKAVPVIVATQMLESMIHNPRPTRAEVSDVANAVTDHADAVMLSGETATGKYPVEAVRVMADTVLATEASRFDDVDAVGVTAPQDADEALGMTTRLLVDALHHPPIVVVAEHMHAVAEISSFRPEVTIHALTSDPRLDRHLRLMWGVESHLAQRKKPIAMMESGLEMLRKQKYLKNVKRVITVTGNRVEIVKI